MIKKTKPTHKSLRKNTLEWILLGQVIRQLEKQLDSKI